MSAKGNVFISPSLFSLAGISVFALFIALFDFGILFSDSDLSTSFEPRSTHWIPRSLLVIIFCTFWTFRYVYLSRYVKEPTLYFNDTPFNKKIVDACHALKSKYYPTFWMVNPHAQLVFADVIKKQRKFDYRREFIKTPDEGTLCLDWVDSTTEEDAPILILLHGLTGGSHSKYITQLAHYMVHEASKKTPNKPWRPVVYVRRGCGVNPITSSVPYSYTSTDDFRIVLKCIQSQYPKAPLYAAGFSMGGNLLCKYLGEEGPNTPIKAAITVCSPFEIKHTSSETETYANKFYQYFLLRLVKTKTFTKHKEFLKHLKTKTNSSVDFQKVHQAKSLKEFDEHFTIKLLGYENVDAYYATAQSSHLLPNITIPTLFLNALNDPIVTAKYLPFEELFEAKRVVEDPIKRAFRCRLKDNMILCTTDFGGHHSYLEGLWPINYGYMDRLLGEYLTTMRLNLEDPKQVTN